MKSIDEEVLIAYNSGIEKNRLRSGLGLIEYERTCEILLEMLPSPPAIIYDIGGGYGEYSWWLASKGYNVSLYDISETNIKMAEEMVAVYPNYSLDCMEVSDARSINRLDESADAILLMGPLYHIVEYSERICALKESFRLLKPGGLLFTAAITRYSYMLWAVTTYGLSNELLGEKEAQEMIAHDLLDGQYIRNPKYRGMGRSFFHLPSELKSEIESAGLNNVDIRGVIGPAWLVPNLEEQWKDKSRRKNIMNIVRMVEKDDSIMGLSKHLLAISQKK